MRGWEDDRTYAKFVVTFGESCRIDALEAQMKKKNPDRKLDLATIACHEAAHAVIREACQGSWTVIKMNRKQELPQLFDGLLGKTQETVWTGSTSGKEVETMEYVFLAGLVAEARKGGAANIGKTVLKWIAQERDRDGALFEGDNSDGALAVAEICNRRKTWASKVAQIYNALGKRPGSRRYPAVEKQLKRTAKEVAALLETHKTRHQHITNVIEKHMKLIETEHEADEVTGEILPNMC